LKDKEVTIQKWNNESSSTNQEMNWIWKVKVTQKHIQFNLLLKYCLFLFFKRFIFVSVILFLF